MGGSRRVPLPTARTAAKAAGKRTVAAAATTGTYVYCVVRGARRPVVGSGVESLPGGGPPRVLPLARGTWLIVADVPMKAFGQDALNKRLQDVDWMSRCGVAHQAVIESFIASDAVVPMRLFTIFANDERAVAEAKNDAARLRASLDRVAGRVEWVVRVLRGDAGDAAAAPAAGTDTSGGNETALVTAAATTGSRDAGAVAPRSGRDFLQAKVNQRQAARRAAEETSQAVHGLFTALSDVADEVSDRTEALTAGALGSTALLDAAFLVARAAEPRFEQAARRMAQPLADRGFRVSVTGPWPCYSFVAPRPSPRD